MHMNDYPTVELKARHEDKIDAELPTNPADRSLCGNPETIQIERPDARTIAIDVSFNGGYVRMDFEDETWRMILAIVSTWLDA